MRLDPKGMPQGWVIWEWYMAQVTCPFLNYLIFTWDDTCPFFCPWILRRKKVRQCIFQVMSHTRDTCQSLENSAVPKSRNLFKRALVRLSKSFCRGLIWQTNVELSMSKATLKNVISKIARHLHVAAISFIKIRMTFKFG